MNCPQHQFINLQILDKAKDPNIEPISSRFNMRMGAKVVCAICGQVRIAWEDGKVEIVTKGEAIHLE